jgi:hypothetical protein
LTEIRTIQYIATPTLKNNPIREMTMSDAKATSFSSGEEDFSLSLSEWLKRRRQELDLTQEQLAPVAVYLPFGKWNCERWPSRQLAELLAKALEIPTENQSTLIQVTSGERRVECLPVALPCPSEKPYEPPETCRGR